MKLAHKLFQQRNTLSVAQYHRYLSTKLHHSAKGLKGLLAKEEILQLPSTPHISPSYPHGPYRFFNREYFIISYHSVLEKVKKVIPKPLVPESDIVLYEWIRMPDSTGFGSYEESGTVIPCINTITGEKVNFVLQMFLNDDPPISCGRELWGFPKKYGTPSMKVETDTIVGKLNYADQMVAIGTMGYKYKEIPREEALKSLTKTQVNLKLIPDVNFGPKIAQLVNYNLEDVNLKFAYEGPARLELINNVNIIDLPVRKVIKGKHILADITLPYGKVLHDYLDTSVKQPEDTPDQLSRVEILNQCSMPFYSPSYKLDAINFSDREYLIIRYECTDTEALRRLVPDELFVNKDHEVVIQWLRTKGTGIGDYQKCEVFVPVFDKWGNQSLYCVMSFANSSSSITYARESNGSPQKYAHPSLSVVTDTINGELVYSNVKVAVATMNYKTERLPEGEAIKFLQTPMIHLKYIPDVTGQAKVAQLVKVVQSNIKISQAYVGNAKLHMFSHVNAPLADLPCKRVIQAFNIHCEMTLPPGTILHDYMV